MHCCFKPQPRNLQISTYGVADTSPNAAGMSSMGDRPICTRPLANLRLINKELQCSGYVTSNLLKKTTQTSSLKTHKRKNRLRDNRRKYGTFLLFVFGFCYEFKLHSVKRVDDSICLIRSGRERSWPQSDILPAYLW